MARSLQVTLDRPCRGVWPLVTELPPDDPLAAQPRHLPDAARPRPKLGEAKEPAQQYRRVLLLVFA